MSAMRIFWGLPWVTCSWFAWSVGMGCNTQPTSPTAPPATPPSTAAPSAPTAGGSAGAFNRAAGITWTVPHVWKIQGPRPMRVATYEVPAASGSEAGELAIYYFGADQGGGVEANVQRWINQMQAPEGTGTANAQRRHLEVGGLRVSMVQVDGTYLYSPRPMSPNKTAKPNFRLLGAVVQAPEGNVFFKLTGPQAVVNPQAFESLLRSVRKG